MDVNKPPDLERKDIEYKIKSGEWKNCPKCDWFYKFTVLKNCPMCHQPSNKPYYEDLPYESLAWD